MDLDYPSTHDEFLSALRSMSLGKAGGESGILPEMIVYGGQNLHRRILRLMHLVWKEGTVVVEWRNATVVPIPKKGNLHVCDNWRGISLLDVVGKLFARVLQDRLQVTAEEILPESQAGVRRGRGCMDMIFVVRQLIEKSIEHDSPLCALFIDLRKAYDSIPRPALWTLLQRIGIPPTMLSVIRSLHDGMEVNIRVEGGETNTINVNNGLRQGCTLAPVLFNVYFSAVVSHWRSLCPDAGIPVRHKSGRKLVGDRTAKSHLQSCNIRETQFADDAAVFTTSQDDCEDAAHQFIQCASRWGLTVSIPKTKVMSVNTPVSIPIRMRDAQIEPVDQFTYLGSVMHRDGLASHDVGNRIAKASRAFGSLRVPIFQNTFLSLRCRQQVYLAVVLSTLLYGLEAWTTKARDLRRLNVFHRHCIHVIIGVDHRQQWDDRITSATLARTLGVPDDISCIIRERRLH